MSYLIEDNAFCPCGSEDTYLKCCKFRKDENIDIEAMLNNDNRLNADIIGILKSSKISMCFHPNKDECSKKIIEAHSLQENGVLSLIAENGEVVFIEPGVNRKGLVLNFKSKTKRKVTTFKGFCSYHDKELFKPIEDNDYDCNNHEHNFLLAYRAFAHEYYKKIVAMKSFQKMIRRKPSLLLVEEFVALYDNYLLSLNDLNMTKDIFNEALLTKNYELIESKIFKIDYRIGIATSFMYSPYFDFEGNNLNMNHMVSQNTDRLKGNFVTVLPQQDESYVIYSWLKEDREHFNSLINQLNSFSKSDVKRTFKNLILEYTEHLVLSPRTWNSFPKWAQDEIRERVEGELGAFNNGHAPIESLMRKIDINQMSAFNLFKKLK